MRRDPGAQSMLSPAALIDALADKKRRNRAIVELVGAINSKDLRRVAVTPEAKAALIAGLAHPNAKVRRWCLQLMDHLPRGGSTSTRSTRSKQLLSDAAAKLPPDP